MKLRVKAWSAAPIQAANRHWARFGLACLATLGSAALLGIGAPAASAVDTCPNVVFRTGPSARLADCRAYELVSPEFTGGLPPSAVDFVFESNQFPSSMITPGGDDVVFNTQGGAIGESPGTGTNDRYRVRRTADGWVTQFYGATGAQTLAPNYGGISEDHDYYFLNAGSTDSNLQPDVELQERFGGHQTEYVRTPSGFKLLAEGTEGAFANSVAIPTGRYISPHGDHIIFNSLAKLEPEAPPTGTQAIYDKTPSGNKVLSLLPGNVPMTEESTFLGASHDGSEAVLETGNGFQPGRFYVRIDDSSTQLVARPDGVVVGQRLACTGSSESGTLTYQWLRNGTPIAGATSPTYTVAPVDEAKELQCQVTASDADGTTIGTSEVRVVVPYGNTNPPAPPFLVFITIENTTIGNHDSQVEVGQTYTCAEGTWKGNPAFSYQWLRNDTPIAGATSATYTPVLADLGGAIQCQVTGTNPDGTAVSASPAAVAVTQLPIASAAPEISDITAPNGGPEAGDELTCSPGSWSNSPSFTYQWLRNDTPIAGATSATYTVSAADKGEALQCSVTAAVGGIDSQAVSNRAIVAPQPATAAPEQIGSGQIFGSGRVGSTLFCLEGQWTGEPSISPQWLRNGVEIAGATEFSYTLTAADSGALIECRLTATNAGGSVIAVNASHTQGAYYVSASPPEARASLPEGGMTYLGAYGGHVFFADKWMRPFSEPWATPSDLLEYDIADETITPITLTGDASAVNISKDGSHVYFTSRSEIGGEGTAGEPNLYVWTTADQRTKFIADLAHEDVESVGFDGSAGLTTWPYGVGGAGQYSENWNWGLMNDHSRTTPDGSVLVFESRARLTSFDNAGHMEIYRYAAGPGSLGCVSCPEGAGPAVKNAQLVRLDEGSLQPQLIGSNTLIQNVTDDGQAVVFMSEEGLVPRDGNERLDVYEWKQGGGLSLISTGQSTQNSLLYAMTPDGSNIVFKTYEQLLPQDENGEAARLYDARLDGGFPPPESSVTEKCSGDICQGASSATPESPPITSASVNGTGNLLPKIQCRKGKRRTASHGKAVCVRPKHHKRRHHRARADRGTGR